MYKVFKATRISESNMLFPPTIILNDEGVTVKLPAITHYNTEFIPYNAVSSVHIHTPLVGFSTITFYAYGRAVEVHGFYKSEVQSMKRIVEQAC
ncbi:MAG: hypothetical protein IJP95_00510 [Bacteroidales bacterium]|nr:hypothetical protein [Bacteroidales bacterium]